MFLTKENYLDYASRVIEWNKVANGGQHSTDIEGQKKYTLSECEELDDAIKENDSIEILDAVCDIFVTASYLRFQLDNCVLKDFDTSHKMEHFFFKGGVENETILHNDVFRLLVWACMKFSKHQVLDYMERVLSSNESKFVPDELWDKEYEERMAAEKYSERGFKDIVGVPGELNGTKVWILRADNGKGKILKPTTFKEPSEIILAY